MKIPEISAYGISPAPRLGREREAALPPRVTSLPNSSTSDERSVATMSHQGTIAGDQKRKSSPKTCPEKKEGSPERGAVEKLLFENIQPGNKTNKTGKKYYETPSRAT